ncbi:hypothetical protein [Algoriphagus namhaensis]
MNNLIFMLYFLSTVVFSQAFNHMGFEGRWVCESGEFRMELVLDFHQDFPVNRMFPKNLQNSLPEGIDVNQDAYLITAKIFDKKMGQYIVNDGAHERDFLGYVSLIIPDDSNLRFLLIENELEKGRSYWVTLSLLDKDLIRMVSFPTERLKIAIGDESAPEPLPIRVPQEVIFARQE